MASPGPLPTWPGDNGGGSLVQARCAKSSRLAGMPSLFSPVIRSAARRLRSDWNLLRRAPLTSDWLDRRSPVHLVTGGDQKTETQEEWRHGLEPIGMELKAVQGQLQGEVGSAHR